MENTLTPHKKMATKIEGISMMQGPDDGDPMFIVGTTMPRDSDHGSGWLFPRSTLIIHDGPPERVYTESEVRALLKEVGSQKGIWIVDVQRVAERHGLASPSNPL